MLTIVTAVAVRRLLLLFVAGVDQAHAQEAGTDDILCTDGSEVPGRVLTILPLALRYLPPAGTDTLRLATADVLLVRYANGTREVLYQATSTKKPQVPDLFPDLSDVQRRTKGRQDTARSYTTSGPSGVRWARHSTGGISGRSGPSHYGTSCDSGGQPEGPAPRAVIRPNLWARLPRGGPTPQARPAMLLACGDGV